MDDRRPNLDDQGLLNELASWFDSEVYQAALDLQRTTLRPVRSRAVGSRTVVGPVTAVAVLAILIAAVVSRLPLMAPGTPSTDSASPAVSGVVPPTVRPSIPGASDTPAVGVVGARHTDGIPSLIDGEPVLRPTSVERGAPTDASSFLLGGWLFDFGPADVSCLVISSPAPFGQSCGQPYIADTPIPGAASPVWLDRWTPDLPSGPVVLRVHRHDPLAKTCPEDVRSACESMAVIEEVVWAGDNVTVAAPVSVTQAVNRLAGADPDLRLAELTAASRLWVEPQLDQPTPAPEVGRLPFGCNPPFPTLSWSVAGSRITYLLVFPSVEARDAVDQDLTASGWRGTTSDGTTCYMITDSLFSHEWVAGANVMVAVQTTVSGPTAAEAALIEAVRGALDTP